MKKTKQLAFGAMIIAIILLMALVPQLGYIQINLVAITIIHIPVLIGAMTFKDRNLALIAGTTFGISSWLVAMFRPASPVDLIFQNPLVSIFPRILFGLLAYWLYKQLTKKIEKDYLAITFSVIISTLFHTVSVVSLMFVFGQHIFTGSIMTLLISVLSINGWIEIVLAALIVPPIVKTLQKTIRIG